MPGKPMIEQSCKEKLHNIIFAVKQVWYILDGSCRA